LVDDLPLFSAVARAPAPKTNVVGDALIEALSTLSPDDMSPREALEALYALKLKVAKTSASE
jgi:DNA mismatch repair protein MutS